MSIENDYKQFKFILEPVLREELILDKKYCSPIPRNGHYETTASFKVFEGYGECSGVLFWRDWGLTDQKGARPVDLIMRLHNVDKEKAEEMLDSMDLPEVAEYKRQKKYKLSIVDRPQLTKDELAWWSRIHVGSDLLDEYNVWGVDRLYAGKSLLYTKDRNLVAFSYRGGEELKDWQFYQPEPKTFWRFGDFIYGWDQLPYTMDDLIICSGMKDGLCTIEASDTPFIAGSGEGAWRQVKKLLPTLKRRAKRIWTLMDPDNPGIMATRVFKEELGLLPLPFKYVDTKMDIAKLSEVMGIAWLRNRFHEAFNRI